MAVCSNPAAFRAGLSPVLPVVLLLSIASPAIAQVPRDSAALADSAKLLSEQAKHAFQQGTRESLEGAMGLWLESCELYRRLGDRGREGRTLNAIGAVHYSLGRADSALFYYQQALKLSREAVDRPSEGNALGNIGLAHYILDHPDSALFYYRESLVMRRELGDRRGEGSTLGKIGIVHYKLGRPDSALVYYRRALAVSQEVGDRRHEGNTLINVGTLYSSLGYADSALAYLHQGLTVSREVGDRRREGNTLGNIGAVHHNLGRLDSALVYYRQALAVSQEVGHRHGEAATLSNIGETHRVLGRPDSALFFYRQALAISREVDYRSGEASSLHNIGTLYDGLGRPDSALLYYRQSLAIEREVGNRRGEGLTLNNIGAVHHNLGRPDSALRYYWKALPIRRDAGDRRGEGETLGNIGNVHLGLGQSDSALSYLHRSRMIMQEVGDQRQEGTALGNIGIAHSELGYPDSAVVYYRKALAIHQQVGDRRGEANTVGNIAIAQADLGRPDSALVYCRRALATHRDIGDREGAGVVLEALGHLHYRRLEDPRPGAAVAYFDSAAAIRASVAAHAGSDPNRLSYAEQYVGLFEDWSLAWLALSDEVGSQRSARSALAVAERGRAQGLLDLMWSSAGAAEGVVSPVQALTKPGADLTVEGARLAEAVTRTGAAGLSYLIAKDTLLVWLIEPSGAVSVAREPVSRDSVVTLVRALRAGLGVDDVAAGAQLALRGALQLEVEVETGAALRRGVRYAETAADVLAELLLPVELASRLPGAGELVIVPQGPLALVPFGALPLGRRAEERWAEPFGNRYAIRYAPSLATLGLVEKRPGVSLRVQALREAVLVGNPRMPEVAAVTGERVGLAPLPRAEAEAGWLAERLGVAPLNGAQATESIVRQRLSKGRLVHLATHGYAYSTEAWARESFVALAPDDKNDGRLTVGEILDDPALELEAELVVLSACQTGLGDLKEAEGTVGLQRAFLAKGARSVLVSLWSVSDVVTEELMKRFYTHWLEDEDGPRKAEALRRAQEEVRKTPGWEHPRYWAAFQLVGAR